MIYEVTIQFMFLALFVLLIYIIYKEAQDKGGKK